MLFWFPSFRDYVAQKSGLVASLQQTDEVNWQEHARTEQVCYKVHLWLKRLPFLSVACVSPMQHSSVPFQVCVLLSWFMNATSLGLRPPAAIIHVVCPDSSPVVSQSLSLREKSGRGEREGLWDHLLRCLWARFSCSVPTAIPASNRANWNESVVCQPQGNFLFTWSLQRFTKIVKYN